MIEAFDADLKGTYGGSALRQIEETTVARPVRTTLEPQTLNQPFTAVMTNPSRSS